MRYISCPSALCEVAYEVEGKETYNVLGSGKNAWQLQRSFRISVKGCEWLIRTWDEADKTRAEDYSEIGTDGTNTYEVVKFILDRLPKPVHIWTDPTGIIKRAQVTNLVNLKPPNPATASVAPGVIPADDGALAPPVWLAYGSRCYLDSATNGRLKQVWIYDGPPDKYREADLRATWRLSESEPRFPAVVTYFHDGTGYIQQGSKYIKIRAPKPYDRGFTNAIFEVLCTTNIGNSVFPLRSRLTRFERRPGGTKSTDLIAITINEVQASKVILSSAQKRFLPDLPKGTIVTDRRLSQKSSIDRPFIYTSGDGNWLSLANIQEVERMLGMQPPLASSDYWGNGIRHRPSKWLIALFALPILIFGAIFISNKRVGGSEEQQKL